MRGREHRIRWSAFALGWIALTGIGCGSGKPAPTPTAQESATPVKTVSFHGDNATCAACHVSIYDEWLESRHAQAWKSDTFRVASENYTRQECLSCHAPDLILRTGLGSQPALRADHREGGVTCIVCHQDANATEWAMHGPYEGEAPAHKMIANPTFQSSEVCASCHGQSEMFDQYHPWKESKYGEQGYPCHICHLDPREGLLADKYSDKPVRWIASHRFEGAHSERIITAAVAVSGREENGSLVVDLQNQAGHHFPGGAYRTAVLTAETGGREIGRAEYSYESGRRIASNETISHRFPLPQGGGTAEVRVRFYKVVVAADGKSVVREPEGLVIAETTVDY